MAEEVHLAIASHDVAARADEQAGVEQIAPLPLNEAAHEDMGAEIPCLVSDRLDRRSFACLTVRLITCERQEAARPMFGQQNQVTPARLVQERKHMREGCLLGPVL